MQGVPLGLDDLDLESFTLCPTLMKNWQMGLGKFVEHMKIGQPNQGL